MKTIRILHYQSEKQDRIRFVRALAENSDSIGLKKAKELQDSMLSGVPIEYELPNSLLERFIQELEDIKVKYEVLD